MERIRLVGIARGGAQRSGPVLVQRTVVADDQGAFGRIDVLDPFDIELDDGRILRVDATKEARIEPPREEKIPWGDIESDPAFAPIREKGPGPHVMVVLRRSAIRDGDRIALDGEEKDWAFEDEESATMRTAPTKKLVAVSADVLASGTDAEKIVAYFVDGPPPAPARAERKAKKKKERAAKGTPALASVTPARVVLLVAALFLVVAARMQLSPLQLDVGSIGLGLVGLSAYLSYGLSLPRFVRGEKAIEDNARTLVGVAIATAIGAGTLLSFALLSDSRTPNPIEPSNASAMVVIVIVAWLVGLIFALRHFTKATAAIVSALARAPSFVEGFRNHDWGSANGTVRDPTPINYGGDRHAVAQIVDVRVQSGSDPDIVVEKVINNDTFFVDTDEGSFELHPKDATWASSVRQLMLEEGSRKRWAYVVPLDGSVVVAGRAARPTKNGKVARFMKGSSDSLLFYATAGHKDALAEIRGMASARSAAIAVALGCAALMIGWTVVVAHDLPPFHLEGGGGDG